MLENPTVKEFEELKAKFDKYHEWFKVAYPGSDIQHESLMVVQQAIQYDLMRAKEWEKYQR